MTIVLDTPTCILSSNRSVEPLPGAVDDVVGNFIITIIIVFGEVCSEYYIFIYFTKYTGIKGPDFLWVTAVVTCLGRYIHRMTATTAVFHAL